MTLSSVWLQGTRQNEFKAERMEPSMEVRTFLNQEGVRRYAALPGDLDFAAHKDTLTNG
jgi:hypothetical protein